jgi:acetyl-CoA acyltransferase
MKPIASEPSLSETRVSGLGLEKVAVCAALRTPFVKSFGVFEQETALSLSVRVVTEILSRSGLDMNSVGEVIWGTVIPQLRNPNVARDLVLFAGLPKSIPGYTLNRACASGLQAIQCASDSIALGRCQAVVAGGVEVMSDVPIAYSEEARRFLTKLSRSKSFGQKLSLFQKLNPKAFLPNPPALAEPFSGLTMGEHGEIMAVKNNISRLRQDTMALESHQKASAAWQEGRLAQEVIPHLTTGEKPTWVEKDNVLRPDISLEALAGLKPAFDKKFGTITAGNASALTDGASGVLLCGSQFAKAQGLPILGYIVDSLTVAVDPGDQLLIGPALAIPKLLSKHGLTPSDISIFEIHEAFAAQALSCLDAMESAAFQEKNSLPLLMGALPAAKVNPDGGSLAYGHPFGATGARLVSRALHGLQRTNGRFAVIAVCAAGGMGQAMLVERP